MFHLLHFFIINALRSVCSQVQYRLKKIVFELLVTLLPPAADDLLTVKLKGAFKAPEQ